MAFVFRSPKKLEEKIKPNNNFNFYENFNLLSEMYKKYYKKNNINKSQISFGSTSLRNSLNFVDGSESPGPGSYKVQKSFIKNSFNENLTSPNDPDGIEGEPTQIFISRERRFNEYNTSNKDNPSPGEYFKDKKNFEPNNINQDLSHLKKFGIYPPYSQKRQISIPTNDCYYEVNNDGEIEVKKDLDKIINTNLGPGSYNAKYIKKNNNSIDWSKTAKQKETEKNQKNKKKDKKEKNLNLRIYADDFFNNSSVVSLHNDSKTNDKTYESNNLLTRNVELYADKICNTELLNQKGLDKNKNNKLHMIKDYSPGPGEYEINCNVDAPIKFSNVDNFGSNSSRGLLFPIGKNKIRIGNKQKTTLVIENNINKNIVKNINNKSRNLTIENNQDFEDNKDNKLDKENNSYKLHFQRVDDLKQRYLKSKNSFTSKLGPGSYNPSLSFDKNKIESYVQNFNSLEKRFVENKEQMMVPGVGTYSSLKSYSPKKTYFQSAVPPNVSQRHFIGLSSSKILEMKDQLYYDKHSHPGVGDYFPELRSSIEYNLYKKLENVNDKKPCFNYAEKRFFEFKRKYEDQNQVGKYNLFEKEKEMMQKMIPFSSNVERGGKNFFIPKEQRNRKHLGPGKYRYDSYFDWNKKTYNILFA